MKGFLNRIKEKMGSGSDLMHEAEEEGYVELDTENAETKAKILVRPFVIDDFESIKQILDVLREGNTIALVNIKPLKDRDLVELKRAINKLKKTCDAIEGDIAGFGDNWIAAVPNFARIHRHRKNTENKKEEVTEVTSYGE